MITHMSHRYVDLEALDAVLLGEAIAAASSVSSAILVQVFSANAVPGDLKVITELIAERLPSAIIVGATTVGEIVAGSVRIFV